MSETISLSVTLEGPDFLGIATRLAAHPAFHRTPPDELGVGDRKIKVRADWPSLLAGAKRTVSATWGEYLHTSFTYAPGHIVSATIPDFPADPAQALALLADLPFEVATFGSVHGSWFASYAPPGFSGLQALLGWACAFRGAGHDRLVSRRWLEYGPWRLLRAPGDLSFVQLHDLQADAETALAQARPAHARMGISETGGYLQSPYRFRTDVKGLYVAEDRTLVITAMGPVSQLEMRDACAARRARRDDPKEPVGQVAYMFFDAALAREHLGELWLRELGCLALVDGQKVDMSEGYAPAPVPPEWARRLTLADKASD